MHDGTQVNSGALVGFLEFRQMIFLYRLVEHHEQLLIRIIITDTYAGRIHIFHYTVALSGNLGTGVPDKLAFETRTDYGSFCTKQGNSLAHHVRPHKRTVGVIVFQERNQGCGNGCYLLRSDIHQIDLIRSHDREVGVLTGFDLVTDKLTVIIQGSIALCDYLAFLFLCGHIYDIFLFKIHCTVGNFPVRGFYKSKVVNLRIHAKR